MNKRPTPLLAILATALCGFIFVMGCMRIAEEIRFGYRPWLLAYIVLGLLLILPLAQWILYVDALRSYRRRRLQTEDYNRSVHDTVWPPPPAEH